MPSKRPDNIARITCRGRFLRGLASAPPGAPLDRILRDSAIPLQGLYETGLTAAEYARLLRTTSDQYGDPLLPYRIGLQADIAEFGIYGYSLLSCSETRRMARIAVDYQPLAGYGFDIEVDQLQLKIQDNKGLDTRDNLALLLEFIGATFAIMRSRFSPAVEVPIVAAELQHAAPRELQGTAEELPFPLSFGRAASVVQLNPAILEVEVDHQGAELSVLFLQQCEAELAKLQPQGKGDISARVQSLIYQALQAGVPSQGDIAGQLHLSPRTMNRRLSDQGTSFSQLLTSCRMSLARELLDDNALSIQEISFRLGYAQPNSFFRAYRKHFGHSPRGQSAGGQPC